MDIELGDDLVRQVTVDEGISVDKLEDYFDRLWPICRSITGPGFEKSLDILSELIPFKKRIWLTGDKVHDWIVPNEWSINDAKIYREGCRKPILDFEENNLHVVGYSKPVQGKMAWKDLREYVHTLPDLPDAIPYVTSYYKKRFGFCMTHNQYLELEQEPNTMYHFYIDSHLAPGKLIVEDHVIPGKVDNEIMLASYLCHPSLANNELCGPLVLAGVYDKLKNIDLHHTIRFYLGPENIGMISYLDRFGPHLTCTLQAGLIVHCVGYGDVYTYKESRLGDSLIDRAAKNVLAQQDFRDLLIRSFFPDGGDERQLCSPGYNFPVGAFSRRDAWSYKEYHTSLDNKDLISFDTILESINAVTEIVLTADKNKTYRSTVQTGTPMFAKHEKGEELYQSTMKLNSFYKGEGHRQAMLEIINWSDGDHDLLWIADRYHRKMLDIVPVAEMLVETGYLID